MDPWPVRDSIVRPEKMRIVDDEPHPEYIFGIALILIVAVVKVIFGW